LIAWLTRRAVHLSPFYMGGKMRTDEIDLWVSIEQILTPGEFRVFEMRHRGHMTQRQIAEEVGITKRAIYYRLEKINKKLQEAFHKWLN